ncbi:hypothetical protein [uncultured Chitinophaga sp.]|uniref:hypothetical protein n=1 Tax=uncultured Chitinophaga sp. TaxID=339340 RepID=UPI002639DA60|nr:hypothetical protein [uncultured Chitinophaga sp.]
MQYQPNRALYITIVLLVACILQGCNGCNSSKTTDTQQVPGDSDQETPLTPADKDSLAFWTERKLIQWKSWIDSSTAGQVATDNLQRTTTDTLALADSLYMEEERFEQFKQFFVYSPDSSQVVDMVSYGNFLHQGRNGKVVLEAGEPDTEVSIVNVQTKKRERILFCGPSTVVKQAVWIDDHTILIAGGTYDEQDRLLPAIWKYDTQNKLLENWEPSAP